jgi:hypothetical protein
MDGALMCSRHLEEGAGAAHAMQRYRVHLQADQFDSDSFRFYMEVWAVDPEDARAQAHRAHTHAGIRRIEVVA